MERKHVKGNSFLGMKFGKLIVQEIIFKNEKSYATCQCECGAIETIPLISLRRGDRFACKECTLKEKPIKRVGQIDHVQLWSLSGKVSKNNTSGIKGVYWDKSKLRWKALLQINGEKHYLGSYKLFKDAVAARKEGEEKYWSYFLEKYHLEYRDLQNYHEEFEFKTCPVCGKAIKVHPTSRIQTCGSKECTITFRRRRSLAYKGQKVEDFVIEDIYYRKYYPIAVCRHIDGHLFEMTLKALKKKYHI